MRTIQYVRAGCLLTAVTACMLVANTAKADITTERPGSLLIFPKVVSNKAVGRDTIIQITNTGNTVSNLHCYYIDGSVGPTGRSMCRETDFVISLTRQQPTQWQVGVGRPVNPGDGIAGFDPGLIPPVWAEFEGALVCVEIGSDFKPVAQNKVKGEATIVSVIGDVGKYNAIAVQGNAANVDDNNVLQLAEGGEYNPCPTAHQFNFVPEGSNDPVIAAYGNGGLCNGGPRDGLGCNSDDECAGSLCDLGASLISNRLTVIPCNLNLQTQQATKFTLAGRIWDGDETSHSWSSPEYSCWAQIDLATIPPALLAPAGPLNGPVATLRLMSVSGGPVLMIGESFHVDADGNVATSAVNVHSTGLCQEPGTQAPDLRQACQTPADCPTGFSCVLSQPAAITLP